MRQIQSVSIKGQEFQRIVFNLFFFVEVTLKALVALMFDVFSDKYLLPIDVSPVIVTALLLPIAGLLCCDLAFPLSSTYTKQWNK
jgi:hypothetical protein